MKKSLIASCLMMVTFLAGCGSSATIGGVGIPGNSRDAETNAMGNNSALHYLTDASIEDACATQVKLMTDAKWTESEAMENKGNYLKATYTNGKDDLVVLCSQTEVSATQKATKVTLTLMTNGG